MDQSWSKFAEDKYRYFDDSLAREIGFEAGVEEFQKRVLEVLEENYKATKRIPEGEIDTTYKQDVLIETYKDLISIIKNLKYK